MSTDNVPLTISERCSSWLYLINVFLGFLPPITTKHKTNAAETKAKLSEVHTYIALLITSIVFIYSFIQGTEPDDYGSQLATHVVLTHLSFILMYISLIVTYIHVRIKNGAAILSLLTEINNMDAKFATKLIPGWKFTLEVFFSVCLTIFYVIYEEVERNSFNFYSTFRKLFIASSVILGLQIHSFGIHFQQRFEEINKLLVNVVMVPRENQYQRYVNVDNNEKFHVKGQKRQNYEAKDIYNLFLNLVNTVTEFNRIFGWQILFLCGTFVLCVLHVINLMIVVLNFYDWSEINIHFWVMFVSYLLTTLVLCIPFASSCNGAAEEAKTTALLAYTVLAQKPQMLGYVADCRQDLQLIASVPWPGFTAAGFFDVDHTMLFTLFGSVTSYLIVLIQLKDMRM